MSVLTVDTEWIVGEPSKGVQLAQSVVAWASQATGWSPDATAQKDLDKLYGEIQSKYEHGSEGWFAFATVIVDAVLNRVYPYLINYSQINNYRITSSRKEVLTPELSQVVVYTLDGYPSDQQPSPEGEQPSVDADPNPYPRPPEIDPSTVPIPPGSPIDPYGPTWPGVPYDPLDPLRREPSPYPPRVDQPDIPWLPGSSVDPDSPIQERLPSQYDEDRGLPPIVFPPREQEIQIRPIDSKEPSEGEPKPSEGEPKPSEGEPKPSEENQNSEDIKAILLAILQEIIRQGALNRTALQDAVLALQGTIQDTGNDQEEIILEASTLIADILGNDMDTTNYLLSDIKGIIDRAISESVPERDSAEQFLIDALDTLDDGLTKISEAVHESISALLNGLVDSLSILTDTLLSLGGDIVEAVTDSVTGFYDIYTNGIDSVIKFIGDSLEFDPKDFSRYICEFLTSLQNIRNECGWLSSKVK